MLRDKRYRLAIAGAIVLTIFITVVASLKPAPVFLALCVALFVLGIGACGWLVISQR